MGKIHKLEKFFDVLMSFATLVGFASTAVLAWTFLNTKPGPITSGTSNVGVPGFSLAQYPTLIIQGVPFFWIFFSLVNAIGGSHLSFGKTHSTIDRRKELLPACSPSHAHSTDPHTNCSKTETD